MSTDKISNEEQGNLHKPIVSGSFFDAERLNDLIENMEMDGYTPYADKLREAFNPDEEEIRTRRSILDDILSRFKEGKLSITETLDRLL